MKRGVTELNGYALGDVVKLKIACVGGDGIGKVNSFKVKEQVTGLPVCRVKIGKDIWGPIWFDEMEKANG